MFTLDTVACCGNERFQLTLCTAAHLVAATACALLVYSFDVGKFKLNQLLELISDYHETRVNTSSYTSDKAV